MMTIEDDSVFGSRAVITGRSRASAVSLLRRHRHEAQLGRRGPQRTLPRKRCSKFWAHPRSSANRPYEPYSARLG